MTTKTTGIESEPLRPLALVLADHPNTATIHPRTGARWALKGVHTPAGVVRLGHRRVGGRLMSSDAALNRFLAAVNAPTTDAPALPRSPAERAAASTAAAAELEAAGV